MEKEVRWCWFLISSFIFHQDNEPKCVRYVKAIDEVLHLKTWCQQLVDLNPTGRVGEWKSPRWTPSRFLEEENYSRWLPHEADWESANTVRSCHQSKRELFKQQQQQHKNIKEGGFSLVVYINIYFLVYFMCLCVSVHVCTFHLQSWKCPTSFGEPGL